MHFLPRRYFWLQTLICSRCRNSRNSLYPFKEGKIKKKQISMSILLLWNLKSSWSWSVWPAGLTLASRCLVWPPVRDLLRPSSTVLRPGPRRHTQLPAPRPPLNLTLQGWRGGWGWRRQKDGLGQVAVGDVVQGGCVQGTPAAGAGSDCRAWRGFCAHGRSACPS